VVLLIASLVGVLCAGLERVVLHWTGMGLVVNAEQNPSSALFAMFLLAAPLEEASKAAVVWPLYVRRKIADRYQGLLLGVLVGAGFAAGEGVFATYQDQSQTLLPVRLLLAAVAHAFAGGLWGYVLGRARGRWFVSAWLVATLVRALHDHIVLGRGPGMLVVALPITVAMLGLGWSAIRDMEKGGSAVSRSSLLITQPPPLQAIRRALRRAEKPLMLRWVGVGAFVTAGAILVCLSAGVLLGHRLGIDFSLADEADARSNGPLMLLGAAVMTAFPIAGFLITRASGSTSVLEAALGASLTIGLAVVALTMAAPVAVLFALAIAPVAFLLVCGGAWLGISR
ncbi:MAG TPA: PrsW family glutamic-type intramembrane protease, partial [Polyangiaceae bacterium]|nr:PrsW family glutamic-type intramembrane protease [Polyangiaceae bacterium]